MHLGLPPEALLDTELLNPFSDGLLSDESVETLREALARADVMMGNPVTVTTRAGSVFHLVLHETEEGVVMDWERDVLTQRSSGSIKPQMVAQNSIQKLQNCPLGDVKAMCRVLCEEVQMLTQYDRCMCYMVRRGPRPAARGAPQALRADPGARPGVLPPAPPRQFHDDAHGEVVAEAVREGVEPMLGLHFPATDIPQAARNLFVVNRSRMIVNIGEEPTTMVQTRALTKPVLLGRSQLRGIAGCHAQVRRRTKPHNPKSPLNAPQRRALNPGRRAQYMTNMGTVASLVLSLVVSGAALSRRSTGLDGHDRTGMRLWGLLVCHHKTERYVPYTVRSAAELVAQARRPRQ